MNSIPTPDGGSEVDSASSTRRHSKINPDSRRLSMQSNDDKSKSDHVALLTAKSSLSTGYRYT